MIQNRGARLRECVWTCSSARAWARKWAAARSCFGRSLMDAGFTMCAFPSVPVKCFNWHITDPCVFKMNTYLLLIGPHSPKPQNPQPRVKVPHDLSHVCPRGEQVSQQVVYARNDPLVGVWVVASWSRCLSMPATVWQAIMSSLFPSALCIDTTRGNRRRTSWTRDCSTLSKTGTFRVGNNAKWCCSVHLQLLSEMRDDSAPWPLCLANLTLIRDWKSVKGAGIQPVCGD